jgi:ABC-type sugar transport system substrate-binding protein
MKRVSLIIVLSLILVGLIFAGGRAESPKGGLVIGSTLFNLSDQYVSKMERAIIAEGKAMDVTIDSQDASQDSQRQLDQVRAFAAKGYDVMLVQLVDTTMAQAVVNAANGIPIVWVNHRPVDGSVLQPGKSLFCGSDESLAGQIQAEYLARLFKDRTGPIRYVMFMGTLGYDNTRERTIGVKNGLENAGFILERAFEDTADWDRAIAMDKMATFLGTGTKFDCVICNNDEMALGCVEAMKAAGIDLKSIPVVGVDAMEIALKSIKSGEMAASAFGSPTTKGKMVVDLAIQLVKGEISDTEVYDGYELVDIANVDKYM